MTDLKFLEDSEFNEKLANEVAFPNAHNAKEKPFKRKFKFITGSKLGHYAVVSNVHLKGTNQFRQFNFRLDPDIIARLEHYTDCSKNTMVQIAIEYMLNNLENDETTTFVELSDDK